MIEWFLSIDFMILIWLMPTTLLFHEAEEWNIMGWYKRNFNMPADKSSRSTRFFLVFITLVCFIWTGIAFLTGKPVIAAYIILPFIVIIFQNVLQHFFWLYYFKEYAPGVITSTFLVLPALIIIIASAMMHQYINGIYIIILLVLALPGFFGTIKAGNNLPSSFSAINRFSNFMVNRLFGNK